MNYKDMVGNARARGVTSESTMWASIEGVSSMMDEMRYSHPDLYWSFMRKQYGILFSHHYQQEYAEYDVSNLSYTDRDGNQKKGPHWTSDQIEEALTGFVFPEGTTRWDRYVAFNAAYADFCKDLDERQIIIIGYRFFFADEDWPTDTKTWDYFCLVN